MLSRWFKLLYDSFSELYSCSAHYFEEEAMNPIQSVQTNDKVPII